MFELDHVIVRVADLDEAGERFDAKYGLGSVFGGRHAGIGTANRIVPLGRDYLELLAVVDPDEHAQSGLSLPDPEALVGWMVRTDDIEGVAARLGLTVRSLSRTREDGVRLEWKLAGLELLGREPALPMFIDWSPDQDHHPTRMAVDHAAEPGGIAWIEVSGDRDRIAAFCEGGDLPVRVVDGPSAVLAVGVVADGREVVLH